MEASFANPFLDQPAASGLFGPTSKFHHHGNEIVDGAFRAAELYRKRLLPSEDDAMTKSLLDAIVIEDSKNDVQLSQECSEPKGAPDLIISVRIAFTSLITSLIDASPSEICVLSFKNINAFANWRTSQTSDSAFFITVTDLQVDNMLPNAAFPVAVCRDDEARVVGDISSAESPPLLVIGLSFAPRHKSGIVVSFQIEIQCLP